MAHLWKPNDSGGWVIAPDIDAAIAHEGGALMRLDSPPETWALLAPPSCQLRVNGTDVPLGIAVLSDRDELCFSGDLLRFFSTEALAQVESFPAGAGGYCPRCKLSIEVGSAAVRCPTCGLWHHATGETPCWTYAPTCAGCAQDTAPETGFRWTPEDL